MAGKDYKRWSRDITRHLNNMLAKDRRAIQHIMDVEAERTREYLENNMPVRTGELKRNVFLGRYDTENGSGVGVGISSSKHNPDKFTNTKLAGWLLNKPNREPTYADKLYGRKISNSQEQMRGIYNELKNLKYNVANKIDAYWKSKQK